MKQYYGSGTKNRILLFPKPITFITIITDQGEKFKYRNIPKSETFVLPEKLNQFGKIYHYETD